MWRCRFGEGSRRGTTRGAATRSSGSRRRRHRSTTSTRSRRSARNTRPSTCAIRSLLREDRRMDDARAVRLRGDLGHDLLVRHVRAGRDDPAVVVLAHAAHRRRLPRAPRGRADSNPGGRSGCQTGPSRRAGARHVPGREYLAAGPGPRLDHGRGQPGVRPAPVARRARCHGPGGVGPDAGEPKLAGRARTARRRSLPVVLSLAEPTVVPALGVMRLLLLAGGEVALVAMLLVGNLRLLPSGEPGLAVLLRRVLILFLSTGEVGADRCRGLLGHRGLLSSPLIVLRLPIPIG